MNVNNSSSPTETDWERLDRMSDAEIDYSDIPPLEDKFFAEARVFVPAARRASYVELDQELLAWFREHDRDHPALMNLVLRKFVEIQNQVHEPAASDEAR